MGEHAAYPQWVLHLIETKFYELYENHSDPNKAKLCNFFCMDCTKSPPFCDHCNNSNVHEGHRVIQVYRSSYSPGIKIPVIKTLFDISEIQPYSINRNFIIYIQQRAPKENSNGSGINQSQRPLSNHKQRNYCETNHMRKRRWKHKRSKRSRQIDDDEVFVSINGCDKQFSYTRRKRRKGKRPCGFIESLGGWTPHSLNN
ncbi:transcription repressor PLATZ family [Salix suchowensis]|nr:transcription repressor PLATZ family [Salix suchowensis]